jgi:hypothetical protein
VGHPRPQDRLFPYLTDHGQKRLASDRPNRLACPRVPAFLARYLYAHHVGDRFSPSNRRSITLSIRGQRSLCVDPARLESVPTTILSDLDRREGVGSS